MIDSLGFSLSSLFASFVFGVIGYAIFKSGKRNGDFEFIIIGLLMMTYPIFTKGPYLDWGIGFVLCGLAYLRKPH